MYIVKLINGNITTPIHNEKHKLKSGDVVKGINTIDSFTFTLLPDNAGFKLINDFTTLVSVYNTNKKRYDFFGRVLYSSSTMDTNGLITKEVVCESYFGFLCDSQQPYVDTKNWTVTGLLQHIIDRHNEQVEEYKRFKIGTVTVTDPNNNLYEGIQRENTWNTIQEKLIGKLGGEIRFRVESDGIYIDYLTEIGVVRSTTIEMSKNMKSITKEVDPSSYISRLIPLGCKLTKEVDGEEVETEERVDITSVNDGKNYIDVVDGIETYGIHTGYAYWDDVTEPSVLLNKARNYLMENNRIQIKYSISAIDLSLLGLDIDDFDVHNYHPIINPLLGIDDTARINKKNIDVCDETKSTIEVGDNFKTLSELQREQLQALKDEIGKIKLDTSDLSGKVSVTINDLNKLNTKIEGIDGTYLYIMYSPYEDGHEMTNTPDENTMYMGTCNTSEEEAPTDHTLYKWVKVRGVDGEDGTPGLPGTNQYFHIKYSNDGINFTANNGEVLGDWMGTCVDNTEDDPADFDAYKWHRIKGEQGVPGHDGIGIDGTSSYFHIRYSEVANPTTKEQMTENPSKYIGTYVDHIEDDSDDPKMYKWVQFMGADGIPGEDGKNGLTYYVHIKYSDDGGKTFTSNNGETSGKYIGVYTDTTQADSTSVSFYTWSLLKGADGKDGTNQYFYVRYSANANGASMTTSPQNDTAYMGVCATTSSTAPTSYTDYTWTKIKGNQGEQGVPGAAGKDGKSQYWHIKYSDDGTTFTANNGETLGAWIGTCVDYNETDPTSFSAYTWKKFTGDIEVGGRNLLLNTATFIGDNVGGISTVASEPYKNLTVRTYNNSSSSSNADIIQFLKIYPEKLGEQYTLSFYAKGSGTMRTYFYGETGYLQCVKSVQSNGVVTKNYPDGNSEWTLTSEWQRYWVTWTLAETGDITKEKKVLFRLLGGSVGSICGAKLEKGNIATDWTPAPEDVDENLDDIKTVTSSNSTDIERTENKVGLIASKSYVETSAFDEYKEEVTAEFGVRAEEINMKFTTTTEQIENVDGDLQSKFEKVYKHIAFNDNGITIGSGDSAIELVIDNESGIVFKKNGVQFGWWDGTDFHTGNIVVEVNERAQFGNFAFVPRSDGSLSFLKVQGTGATDNTGSDGNGE